MDMQILTPDELSRWLNGGLALYLSHPEEFTRQVLEIARALQVDVAGQLAELHRSLNGGW